VAAGRHSGWRRYRLRDGARMIQWIEETSGTLGAPLSSQVCIPETQKRSHVFWETAALIVQVPFMVYLAAQPGLAPWARILAGGIAGATLVVDGSLLNRYRRLDRSRE
jgi:hypothetical protein